MSETSMPRPSWMRGFTIFWRVILIVTVGFGALDSVQSDPTLLTSWRGAVLALLIAGFFAGYEWYEHAARRRSTHWPVPYRHVLFYVCIQLAITIALLRFDTGFLGPLFALMGQVFSSLPIRQWPIPIGALIAIASVPFGLDETIATGNWGVMIGFGFFMISWIGIALFVSVLFYERHERENLIVELRKARDDLERYAAQAEELAALRERTRLAREMHDSLGHALVVVNVKLEAAQRLYAVDAGRGAAELEATRALVREAMAELRRSLADLRAALPNHENFPAALGRMVDEIRARTSLDITCSTPTDLPRLAPETAETLWRIAHEALANVERHAVAASASLTIERSNGSVVLRVIDDGSGVTSTDLLRPGHYGVIGMRERVEALGGTLRIAARAEGGTVVEAKVPVELEH